MTRLPLTRWGSPSFTLALLCLTATALAGHSTTVVQVDEDWELSVSSPDPNVTAPQTMCTFAPFSHLSSLHALVNVNYLNAGDFVPGGLELQIWNGPQMIDHAHHQAGVQLRSDEEIVRWTNRITVANGKLHFAVVQGSSYTWGSFGNNGELTLIVPSAQPNLNDYDPNVSLLNSGVVFAGNRVLRRVRLTMADGQVVTINIDTNVDVE